MYLIFKTDCHHSYASRDLIGIVESKILAIDLCKLQAKKEHKKITPDQLFNLNNISQTQGYSGDGEFDMQEVEINTLL